MVKAYGDSHSFLVKMSPSLQSKAAANLERAYYGTAPTLTVIKATYNEGTLYAWIMAQLESLNDFCGVKEERKMTIPQLEEVAILIATEYHFLKASEILLFMHRFKCGHYGELYGSIDPLRVMVGLLTFRKERMAEMASIEAKRANEEAMKKRNENASNKITYEEYLKRKNKHHVPD